MTSGAVTRLVLLRPRRRRAGTCEADPNELRTPDGKEGLDLDAPASSSIDDDQRSSTGVPDQPGMLLDDAGDGAAAGPSGMAGRPHRPGGGGEALGGEAEGFAGSSSRGRRSAAAGSGGRRSLVSRVSHVFSSKSRVAASR